MKTDNILDTFGLDDIIENLCICNVFQRKENIINSKLMVYYENIGLDFGFLCPEVNLFISLKNKPGEALIIGESSDDICAVSCTSLDLFNDDVENIIIERSKEDGNFYIFNEKEKNFEEITDEKILKLCHHNTEEKINFSDLNIAEMFDKIKKTIISQDQQIMQILASIYKNQAVINSDLDDNTISKLKENIIVYGSTGTGKTEILKQIAKMCGIPIVIEDATSFTETGYVGRDVSEMLNDLYIQANEDLEIAEKGILVIDEFDKLSSGSTLGSEDGPSRQGVQRSLLKLLDGGTVSFSEDGMGGNTISFDTSKLTVVALGAFDNITKENNSEDITIKDFTENGIMREVIGRFSKLVAMNSLDKTSFKKILLESDLSPLNTYKKFFENINVKFTYDEDLIDYISDEAIALNLGARSLKTVFDNIINDKLFDVFAKDEKHLHLTKPEASKSYVLKNKKRNTKKTIGFN